MPVLDAAAEEKVWRWLVSAAAAAQQLQEAFFGDVQELNKFHSHSDVSPCSTRIEELLLVAQAQAWGQE